MSGRRGAPAVIRLACAVANATGLAYLLFLLVTNGFPTAGQPLFIVLLVASGQVSALALAARRPAR